MKKSRRKFIKNSSQFSIGLGLLGLSACSNRTHSKEAVEEQNHSPSMNHNNRDMFFKISLAEWSLHRALGRGKEKATMDHLDFAARAKNEFGIEGVEYVNQFFKDKAKDMDYLKEMTKRADDNGVKQLLIMIDGEGGLAELDDKKRTQAVENHYKWIDAAKFLGCHSIRVNAFGIGTEEEVAKAAVDGLGRLAERGAKAGLNIIVENHGGYSSNGAWLSNVMKQINLPNCGTLPDFGNFCIKRDSGKPWEGNCIEEYDRYKGIKEMMPFAKAVSAKSYDFGPDGEETKMDFTRILKIVKDAGYHAYIGVEYEGARLSEAEGIMATKNLLMKVGKKLSNAG